MKFTALLIPVLLATSVRADLIARFVTDKGTIDVILHHDKAPQAVANFITLAEGTRPHLDPATGGLSTDPYYIGEKFFRVLDTETFKIAQTGSGTGTNSGGPGYTFKDEFDPALRHVPYVLSMANSGPNTNGSQIFFVGNSSPSHLDDVHTVFGQISDPASRAVIDAIHAAGDNGSEITGLTFDRTDPAALAFDEHAQDLPLVSSPSPQLQITPDVSVTAHFDDGLQAGDRYFIKSSPGLLSWADLTDGFVGYDNAPLPSLAIDDATLPQAFYKATVVGHPGSPTPSTLALRTFQGNQPNTPYTFSFTFSEDGSGGTSYYSANDSTGTIQTVIYQPAGYGALLIVDASNLPALRLQMGIDQSQESEISGRHSLSTWNGQWTPAGSGTFTLSD